MCIAVVYITYNMYINGGCGIVFFSVNIFFVKMQYIFHFCPISSFCWCSLQLNILWSTLVFAYRIVQVLLCAWKLWSKHSQIFYMQKFSVSSKKLNVNNMLYRHAFNWVYCNPWTLLKLFKVLELFVHLLTNIITE